MPKICHFWNTSISTVDKDVRFFSRGQSRHFAYISQIVGDATQMDVGLHKKKMFNVTETVAYSVFPVRKLYTEKMFVLVSMDILRLS